MKCIICNKEIDESKYCDWDLCSSECFYKNFWNEQITSKDDENIVRIDGEQYYISNDTSNSIKGFGGEEFIIRFFSSRVIITNDLWYNGVIPAEYRNKLPNNAEFI